MGANPDPGGDRRYAYFDIDMEYSCTKFWLTGKDCSLATEATLQVYEYGHGSKLLRHKQAPATANVVPWYLSEACLHIFDGTDVSTQSG